MRHGLPLVGSSLLLLCAEAIAAGSAQHPISVADLSRYAAIGNPTSLDWNDEIVALPVADYSSDGVYVAVVVRGGNPEQGTNEGRLLIYRTSKLLGNAAPETVVRLASATNYQPIAQVRWLADNETVMFAGTDGNAPSQIYTVNARTHRLLQLTRETAQLVWYDAVPSARRVVMLSEMPKRPIASMPICRSRGCRVTADEMRDAEDGVRAGSTFLSVYDASTGSTRILSLTEAAHERITRCARRLEGGISPDGRFARRRCELSEPPRGEFLVQIDLERDKSVVLGDAPAVSDRRPAVNEGTPTRLRSTVIVEQSLNDPPALVAVDRKTSMRRRILDPNPWLSERELGRVEAVSWKNEDSFAWRGGIYYPPDFDPQLRYPLVIQTHGFAPDQFSLDGRARNFAGRALVAHGIMVLQINEGYGVNGELAGTPAEWAAHRAGYEGAIDYLDGRGLIDRTRMGIQGWSSTGVHMGYMLTHSSYRFAAGAFTDSGDFGWWWYLSVGAPQEVDGVFGASPFGAGLEAWREQSPTFNLQRVNTPMLMWEGQGLGVSGLWDWYTGLRRLKKPVEYWVLPDATHDVFQVGQRMHTNQLLVDWFRFWLKNEEDADVTKKEQYERWRELRRPKAPTLK